MVTIAALAAQIDAGLRARARPERAAGEKAYLRSVLEHYGTSVPEVRTSVRTALHRAAETGPLGHDDVVGLVEVLWGPPVHERRVAAVEVLAEGVAVLCADDIGLLERLVRESRTWALVDALATSVVAPLVERAPGLSTTLDRWATDEDFWIRRAALLALLPALRRGAGDFERFGRYADMMVEEKEFFLRKAIGWVLRDTGRRRPDLVFAWLLPRASRASGVTLREALKPLGPEQREAIEAARGRPKQHVPR